MPAPESEPPLEGLAVVVSVNCPVKLAVTLLLLSMVTTQEPEPEQSPDQLLKDHPELGEGVTVTWEPKE